MESQNRAPRARADRRSDAWMLLGVGLLVVGIGGLVALGVVYLARETEDPAAVAAPPPAEQTPPPIESPLLPACRAMARWGALATPGVPDDAERAAWAEVETEMVGVDSSPAIDAYNEVIRAWNDGTHRVNAEALRGLGEINATGERNSAAIARAAERAAAGDPSAAADLELEEYGLPDTGPLLEAKAAASASVQVAVDRFTSLC